MQYLPWGRKKKHSFAFSYIYTLSPTHPPTHPFPYTTQNVHKLIHKTIFQTSNFKKNSYTIEMSSLVANPHSGTPVNQHRSSLTVSTVPSTSPLRHGQTETETVVEGERQLEDGVPSHLPSPKYADRAGTLRHPSRDNIRKTFAEKTILSSQQAISPTLPMLTDSDLPEADCEWQSMSGPLFSSMSAPRDPSPSFNLSSAAPSFSLVSPSISPAQTPVLNPQTIMAELTIANQSAMDDPVADPKQTAPFAPNGGGSPGNRVFYGNGYVGGAGGGGGSVGPRATAADGGGGGGGGSGSREGSPSGSPRPAAVPQWNNHVPQYGTHASHGSGIFNQGHSAGGGGGGGVYPQKPMHTGEANRMRKIESGVGKYDFFLLGGLK